MFLVAFLLSAAALQPPEKAMRLLAAQFGVKPNQLVWSVDAQGRHRADFRPDAKFDSLSFKALMCMVERAQESGLRVGFISEPPPATQRKR